MSLSLGVRVLVERHSSACFCWAWQAGTERNSHFASPNAQTAHISMKTFALGVLCLWAEVLLCPSFKCPLSQLRRGTVSSPVH